MKHWKALFNIYPLNHWKCPLEHWQYKNNNKFQQDFPISSASNNMAICCNVNTDSTLFPMSNGLSSTGAPRVAVTA